MLTLVRPQDQLATTARPSGCRPIAYALAACVCWTACPPIAAAAQSSPASQTLRPTVDQRLGRADDRRTIGDMTTTARESSILIRDQQEEPVRSAFTARATEAAQRVADPGFKIPTGPTADDFSRLATHPSPAQSVGSQYTQGTFADSDGDQPDTFAAPEPPSLRPRISSTDTTDSDVRPSNEQATFTAPLVQNDLRSPATTRQPDNRLIQSESTVRPLRPEADSLTAARRYNNDRPAPPAAMPATSPRLNPQLFSQQPALRKSLPVDHSPAFAQATQATQPTQRTSPIGSASATAAPANEQPLRATHPIVDQNVASTSYTAPAIGADKQANLAKTIVERYSMDNAPSPLPGEPMSLVEMMQQPLPMQSRRPMVSQYWEAWFDWAATQNAVAYDDWLATIPSPSSAGEKGLLDAARSAAENQVLAAEIQLGKSQAKLLRFMPTRRSDLNPLPSDLPLVERYETHYELYRSRNMMPANLQGIDQMLPRTLKLIQSRAKTVQMSQAAIKQTLSAYRSRQTPLASVLEAARVWRVSEQDLLASVTSYNQAIADYAMNVTGRYTTPEQTVAMLIGVPKAKVAALPTAAQTVQLGQPSNTGRRSTTQNRIGNGSPARTANNSNFGQPTGTNRADAATFGRPTPLTASAGQPSASQQPWMNNTTNSRPKPPTSNQRSNADLRPSLSTSSAGASNPASRRSATGGRSLFDSPSTKRTPRPTPPTGPRPSTNSFGAGSKPATSNTTPTRKEFPLPKKPTRSSNSFGFGG